MVGAMPPSVSAPEGVAKASIETAKAIAGRYGLLHGRNQGGSMYPSSVSGAGVGLGGGALAATGLAVTGYLWAAALLVVVGALLVTLGVLRDRRLATVRAGTDWTSEPSGS
jgi:hypothetical protein